MKLKNKSQIEFICPICNTTEKIPRNVVEYLDEMDSEGVDTDIPPRFECEVCGNQMLPKFYIGVNGKKYFYEDYKDKLY